MKKGLALLTLSVVLFAACGKEGGKTASDVTSTSAPEVTASTVPGAATAKPGTKTPAPAASAAATAKPSSTSGGSGPAPAKPAPAGKSNAPKDGDYVYTLNGTSSNPYNPAGPPQKISGDATNNVTHKGDVYTTVATTSESAGRQTVKSQFLDTRVDMLSFKSETQIGDFACTFHPPLLVTKFPIKPETFPTQHFKGDGNACNGTLDIAIIKKETTKDASGHAWSTWQVKVKLHFTSDQLTLTQNETRWVSPDLGTEIKSVGHTDGKYATTNFTTDTTTVLKKHP